MHASLSDQLTVVKLLIAVGASYTLQTCVSFVASENAIRCCNTAVWKDYYTAVSVVAAHGKMKVLKYFVNELKVDINKQDKVGVNWYSFNVVLCVLKCYWVDSFRSLSTIPYTVGWLHSLTWRCECRPTWSGEVFTFSERWCEYYK